MTSDRPIRGHSRLIVSDIVMIEAPVEDVWAVLTDFPGYREWNPLCHRIEAKLEVGGVVRMFVNDPRSNRLEQFDYRLSAFEPLRLLAWEKDFPELNLWARRDQFLQPHGVGRALYVTTDLYDGSGAADAFAENAGWVREGFNAMANSLAVRTEALARANGTAP